MGGGAKSRGRAVVWTKPTGCVFYEFLVGEVMNVAFEYSGEDGSVASK